MTADPAAAMWAETLGPVDFRGAYEALYGPVNWERVGGDVTDVEGPDPELEAASYPGYYSDIAALEAENRSLRQAEGVLP